jgi:hypothetical protein
VSVRALKESTEAQYASAVKRVAEIELGRLTEQTRQVKRELAEFRARMAEHFYKNSERVPAFAQGSGAARPVVPTGEEAA